MNSRGVIRAISIYLENEGYQAFKAYHALEAIDLIRDQVKVAD